MIFPTIGTKLPRRKVEVVEMRDLRDGPISSPSVRLAKKFEAEAFIASNEPLKVVLASSAATPAIPSSC